MNTMIALAVVLLIAGLILSAVGFVLFSNGTGAAPHQRTDEDPTGVKRATSRTSWGGMVRHLPRNVRVLSGEKASHEDKLTAVGSLLLLCGIGALCVAALSVVVAYV
jgi:hypothetical protein